MKLKAPNGEIITVEEGETPDQAIEKWVSRIQKENNYNPEENTPEAREARMAASEKAYMDEWSGENPLTSKAAGFQAGAKNLGRNLLQMALPESMEAEWGVDDQSMAKKKEQEAYIKDKEGGAYLAGEIIPTMALPVGGGGGAIAGQLSKVGLPKAMQALAPGITRGAVEGGVYGAATAGSEDRLKGALVGGTIGAGGNVLARTLGRVGSGAVPQSTTAKRLQKTLRQQPGGNKKGNVPASMGGDRDKRLSRSAYGVLVKLFPGGKKQLDKQVAELSADAYETILRQSYGPRGDDVVQVFRQAGNMDDAVAAGEKMMKDLGNRANFTGPARTVLKKATASNKAGELPSFQQIYAASKEAFPERMSDTAPFRQLAADMKEVLGKEDGTISQVAQRALFYGLIRKGGAAVPAANTVATVLASRPVQKVLKGDTKLQEKLFEALQTGRNNLITPMLGRIAREAGISETMDTDYAEKAQGAADQLEGYMK